MLKNTLRIEVRDAKILVPCRLDVVLGFGAGGLGVEGAAGLGDALGVEVQVGQEFMPFAVFYEQVGNAQAADAAGVQARVAGGL